MDKQAVVICLHVISVRYDLFYQVKKFQRKFIGVNAAILRQISDRLKLQIIAQGFISLKVCAAERRHTVSFSKMMIIPCTFFSICARKS